MNFSRFLTLTGLACLTLAGCKKYDQNGSLLHLRSPEKRLEGNWRSAEVTQVGTADSNLTNFLASSNLLLDATFEAEGTVVIVNVNEDIRYEGLWAFNDDKSVLHLDELTFTKTTGPFYTDEDSTDQTALAQAAFDFLLGESDCSDTIFFSAGTYEVMTEEVQACYNSLTATGSNWVLADGELNYNGSVFAAGDVINDAVNEYIEGFIDDELLDESCENDLTPDCIADIVAYTLQDYAANIEFVDITEPLVSGWDDPNLLQALNDNCGLDVVWYSDSPTGLDDPAVLGVIADNPLLDLDCDGVNEQLGQTLAASYVTEVKVLDLYWEVLELELDDFQAVQFREYDEETIADYNFLLRFEKQD